MNVKKNCSTGKIVTIDRNDGRHRVEVLKTAKNGQVLVKYQSGRKQWIDRRSFAVAESEHD